MSLRVVIVALAFCAALFSAYSITSEVRAHGTHCVPWDTCGKYYAGNVTCCAPGVGGYIRSKDVSLLDSSDDVVASWMGVLDISGTETWLQAGFWEGEKPTGGAPLSTPHLYTEIKRGDACYPAYGWVDRGLPGGTHDNVYAQYVAGQYEGYCGGIYVYTWWLRRGSPTNPPMDVNFMQNPFGRIDALTEVHNHTHIEPLTNQCFGTTSVCSLYSYYGVRYFDYTSWQLWTPKPAFLVSEDPYMRIGMQDYYAFYATKP